MKRNIKRIILSLIVLLGNYVYGQPINYAKALNMHDVADALPFISGDGLRIYYTTSRNNGASSIFYSSRTNTKSFFKTPVLLGQQFDEDFGSPSLTSDELRIYVMNSNSKKLCVAKRKLKTDTFSALEEIKVLTKNAFYFPAISPDGKQLVVSDYDNEYLIFFERNSSNEFEWKYSFENEEAIFKCGRFSPDGLQLYAVKKGGAKNGVDDILVVFTRKTLGEIFDTYQYVTNAKNELITDVFASGTKDGKLISVTTNATSSWLNNDIAVYAVGKPVNAIDNNKKQNNKVAIYKDASTKKIAQPEPIKKQEPLKKADEAITFTGGQNFDDVGYVAPAINTSTPVYQTITTERGTYVGYAVNGKPNGKGKYTLKSGEVYDGDFINGNLLGKGKCLYPNGDVYEGDLVNYLKVGKGKYTFKNSEVYDGDWNNNKREGKGKYTFINGNVYEGDWNNNLIDGKGKYTFASGEVYDGDWKNGKREGKGEHKYATGKIYYGQWVNNAWEGNGKLTLPNGDVITGTWVNDTIEGNASYYTKATNKTKTEVYKNGNLVRAENTYPGRDAALEDVLEKIHKSSESYFENDINEKNLIQNFGNVRRYKTTLAIEGFNQIIIEKYSGDKTVLIAKNSLPKQEATALFNKLKDALSYYTMFIPGHNPRKEERRNGNLLEYRFAGSNRGEISLLLEQEPFDLDAPIGSAPKFDVIFSIEKR